MTKVVVDLGCVVRNEADSLAELVREYHPDIIYGIDPSPLIKTEQRFSVDGVPLVLAETAAWVTDGRVSFHEDGSASRVGLGKEVGCIDFSAWLQRLKLNGADQIIVKMDIEGAEYDVLKKMSIDGTDALVDELLIEWHGPPMTGLRCPVRDWWL